MASACVLIPFALNSLAIVGSPEIIRLLKHVLGKILTEYIGIKNSLTSERYYDTKKNDENHSITGVIRELEVKSGNKIKINFRFESFN